MVRVAPFFDSRCIFGRVAITLRIGPHSSLWSPYVIGQTIYIFILFLLLSFFSSPNLSSRRYMSTILRHMDMDAKKVAKNRHLGTIAQLCRAISSQLRHISTNGKNLLSSNISSTCPHNMVNFGPLTAEILSGVWDTPTNFNGFCILAALLHVI